MKFLVPLYVAVVALTPLAAQEGGRDVRLVPGHAVYHEGTKEAGIAVALTISGDENGSETLMELCQRLRSVAGLGNEHADGLRLQTLFVVPYKRMAVEGYFSTPDGSFERTALVRGDEVARATLDRIVARAGIPPSVLDEADVELEISCKTDEPLWTINWYDVRRIGEEEPDAVIERAHARFLAIHRSVVQNATREFAISRGAAMTGGE